MANPGVTPPDITTPVGQVRVTLGDTASVALSPIVPNQGDYTYFSDDTITVALSLSSGGVTRAVATLVKQLALSLTIAGQSIKADDFAINTLGKGRDLLEVAKSYTAQADAEDALAAREEDGSFAVVSTRLRPQIDLDVRLTRNYVPWLP